MKVPVQPISETAALGENIGTSIDVHRLVSIFRRRLKLFVAVAALIFAAAALITAVSAGTAFADGFTNNFAHGLFGAFQQPRHLPPAELLRLGKMILLQAGSTAPFFAEIGSTLGWGSAASCGTLSAAIDRSPLWP